MSRFEAAVRPSVTLGIVIAQVAFIAWWAISGSESAKDAATYFGSFTTTVVIFWFKDRTDEKAREATVAAVAAATGTGSGGPVTGPRMEGRNNA